MSGNALNPRASAHVFPRVTVLRWCPALRSLDTDTRRDTIALDRRPIAPCTHAARARPTIVDAPTQLMKSQDETEATQASILVVLVVGVLAIPLGEA